MKKIVRITTSAGSLRGLLKGQLRFMNQYYHVIGIAAGKERLQQVKDREGIDTILLPMTRTISPFKDLIAVYKLYKVLKTEQPFMVHSHTPKAGIVGMLAAKLAGVQHRLHTVAGMPLLEASGFKRTVLDIVEKLTYKYATLVLPNSVGLKDIILENNYTSRNKLRVIGKGSSNGIDTTYFDPSVISETQKAALKKSLAIKENDLVFTFVGRIVKDKGINELVWAFTKLLQQHKDCKLILIGPYESHLDPLKPEMQVLIDTTPSIIVAGRQPDIRPYLAISHALAFPSYREGFPNVVLEASAMNVPCIVTNINGSNEIIKDKENGLIIPTKDADSLFKAMQFFVEHPEERKCMTGNSRPNIVNNYQRQYIWNELLSLYKSLEDHV